MSGVLFISVGGSPAPVIHSINTQQPERVVFFASYDSYNLVHDEILPALEFCPKRFETITTADEQDLVVCVQVILQRLPEILRLWNLGYDSVTADYTGGTKTMSSAVVLSLSSHIRNFSYVGGSQRDKGGLGVVIGGREQVLYLKNPWDILAVETLNDMELMFNRCRFLTVADLAERAMAHAEEKKPLFDALRITAQAFYNWDNFHYDNAFKLLKQACSKLKTLCAPGGSRHLRDFSASVAENLATLETVVQDVDVFVKSTPKAAAAGGVSSCADGSSLILDLVANAVRRAELEYKYDDAVARLYSAIEKLAKIRLKASHGIDNSAVQTEQIPAEFRGKYVTEAHGACEQKLQLPLHRSYELLADLGDPLGLAYDMRREELGKVLTTRNNSLMAHGYAPVTDQTYEKMLRIALDFMAVQPDRLPRFPVMAWRQAGL